MKHDEVEAALAAKRDEGSVVRRLGGLKSMASALVGRGLPPTIRTLVTEAFTGPVYSRSTLVAKKRGEVGEQFADYTPADWNRAIATLLPQFAASATAACDAVGRRPYQDGFTRKPFRSPRSVRTLADVRGRWLLNATILVGEYDADIRWVTEHAAHLASWWGGTEIGWLLAGAIEAGDAASDDVFETLAATVNALTNPR